MRVLVVCVGAGSRRRLAILLRSWGIEVVGEATSALEAVEAARRLRPDAILVDGSGSAGADVELSRALEGERSGTRIVVFPPLSEARGAARSR